MRLGRAGAVLAGALLVALPAAARTITVGDGKEFPVPSAGIAAAKEGDTVLISPGQYFDCAVVFPGRVTIEGDGPGAVLTDKACEGKALLVLRSSGDVIRNITLARARVPDGNGAGIRLEGQDLELDHVTFDNDQVGLLSGSTGGTVDIKDCRFTEGGVGEDRPKYAVMIGAPNLLRIERSTFSDVKGGQITTGADRTELVGNTIGTGTGDGPAPAVEARSGVLLMQDNVLRVGPNVPEHDAAVMLFDDTAATLRGNRLINETGRRIALVLDWSRSGAVLEGNQVPSGDELVTSSGVFRHRVASQYHLRKDETRALAGSLKRFVKQYVLGR